MYARERLNDTHDLSRFDSGKPTLDRWLREQALHAEARNVGRTCVWHAGDGVVVAYYTLASHELIRAELPSRIGHGSPDKIPAYLIGRLALDRTLQGQHLGGALLADALSAVIAANEFAAARFVVVDALDEEAAGFYVYHGFVPIPATNRLVRKISSILG